MYEIIPEKEFLRQIRKCDVYTKTLVRQKLNSIVENPIRNKKLVLEGFNLFRVRINDRGRDLRLIYVLQKNQIRPICIGERKDVYKKLKRYMRKAGYRVKEDVAEYSISIINKTHIPSICYLEPLYYSISSSPLS